MVSDKYILDADGNPVPCDDLMTWGRWIEDGNRTVAKTYVGDVLVSTVFLGLNHQRGEGPPVLWETRVFGGKLDGEMHRYTSRADALKGHEVMVFRVKLGDENEQT